MNIFDATVGRRLLVRIWVHGLLLFAGVIANILIARWVMSDLDQLVVLRHSPYLASAVAGRVLGVLGDRSALAEEVRRVAAETPLAVAVYSAGGQLLASSKEPPLASADEEERRRLAARTARSAWASRRLVTGVFHGDELAAYAVLEVPAGPSALLHSIGFMGMAVLLAFVFVAAPLTHSIARPLERLRALAQQLGAGNLAVRANSRRRDEIGDLARSFDAMAGQLQHLRAAERQLLGGVSHELRTPLARMRVVLDLASDAELERVHTYLGEITTDLAELEQLVDDIIASARLDPESAQWDQAQPPLRKVTIAIDEPIAAALARFRARWPARAIRLVHAVPAAAPLIVEVDPTLLRRVLDNLLDNARLYSPDEAPIEVQIERGPAVVRVAVIDRGAGIAPEDHSRVFSAFFRADRSRSRASGGVGLGLVLARRIVEAHGGAIGFESAVDRGSRFWFELQLASPRSEP